MVMRTARLPGSLELLFTDEPVLDLYAQTPWRVPDGLIDELATRIDGLIADPRSARLTVERHSVLRTPTPAVVADVLGITAFLLGDGAIRAGRRCRLDLDLVERFRTPASVHFRRPTWAAPASPWRPADGELFRCAGEDRALRELAWELTEEILRALEGITPVDERREGLLGLFELVGEDGSMMETVLTTPRGAPEWLRVEELWTDAASDEIVQVLPELTGPVGYLGWIIDGWLGAQEKLADAVAGAGDPKTLLAELLLQSGTTEVPAELAVGARGELYGEIEERLPALASTFHVAEWRQRIRAYLSRALVLGQVELARAFLDLSVRFTAAVQGAPGKPVTPDPCLVPVTEFQADLRRLFRVRQVRHPLSGAAVPATRANRMTVRAQVDPEQGQQAAPAAVSVAASGAGQGSGAGPALGAVAVPGTVSAPVSGPAQEIAAPDHAEPELTEPDYAKPALTEPEFSGRKAAVPGFAGPPAAAAGFAEPGSGAKELSEPAATEQEFAERTQAEPAAAESSPSEPAAAEQVPDAPELAEPEPVEPAAAESQPSDAAAADEAAEPELSGAGLAEVNLGEPESGDVPIVEEQPEAQPEPEPAAEAAPEPEAETEPAPEEAPPALPVVGEAPGSPVPEPLAEPEQEAAAFPEPAEPPLGARNGVHEPAANGSSSGEPTRLSVSDLPRPAQRPSGQRPEPAEAQPAPSEPGGLLAQAYRMIDRIVGQPALAAALREIASSPDQPVRLLVAGPPGTGRGLTVDILSRLLTLRGFHGAPMWIGYEDFARLGTATAVAELRDRLASCRGAQLVVVDGLDRLVNHGLNGKALAEELNRLISGFGAGLQVVGFAAIDGYRRLVDADAALAAWWRVVRTRDFDGADFSTLFSRVVERRGLSVTDDAARAAGDLLTSTPGEGQLRNARLATYLADLAVESAKRRVGGGNVPAAVEVADLPPLQPEDERPANPANGGGRNGNHVTVPRLQPEHDPLAGLGRLS